METTVQIVQDKGVDKVHIIGPINEEAEIHLAQLKQNVGSNVVFNFKQVTFINSLGVRAWINFIREVSEGRTLAFEECTPEIVNQINMIPNFKANATINSVYGSYFCDECENTQNILFEKGTTLPATSDINLPDVKCNNCGAEMEFEEVEDAFFAFSIAG